MSENALAKMRTKRARLVLRDGDYYDYAGASDPDPAGEEAPPLDANRDEE